MKEIHTPLPPGIGKPDFDNINSQATLMVTAIACTILVIYGVVNIILGKRIIGIIELSVGAGLYAFNLFSILVKKHCTAPSMLINLTTIILSCYLFWSGGLFNTGIFWCLSFPGIYIATRGMKRGFIWMGVQILSLSVLFFLSFKGVVHVAYSGPEAIAGLLVYGFSSYILISYEIIRTRYRKEVSKLQEMLPICSVCKKIRDKEGDWHELENYLNRRADMDFTHGLCPDCFKKQYPQYAERFDRDNAKDKNDI